MKKTVTVMLLLLTCFSLVSAQQGRSRIYPFAMEYNPERTLIRVFNQPDGYERYPMGKMTRYMAWLTNIPLKPASHPVIRHDKQIIFRADSVGAVIDIGIASNNQKNADFPIQLAMEYLKSIEDLENFNFIISNDDTVSFGAWLSGDYKYDARGNLLYEKGDKRAFSEAEFYRFLEWVIRKNNIFSLVKNLNPISEKEVAPGDLFIQIPAGDSDSGGHVTVIMDICNDADGNKLFLLGWGGDPAQSYVIPCPLPKTNKFWFAPGEMEQRLAQYGPGKFYRFTRLINK